MPSAMRVGAQSKPWECTPLASKDWINSKSPNGGPEAIKLQRTETTLDLSQKAEKGMLSNGASWWIIYDTLCLGVSDSYGPPFTLASQSACSLPRDRLYTLPCLWKQLTLSCVCVDVVNQVAIVPEMMAMWRIHQQLRKHSRFSPSSLP